jgi:hypothetical protein
MVESFDDNARNLHVNDVASSANNSHDDYEMPQKYLIST